MDDDGRTLMRSRLIRFLAVQLALGVAAGWAVLAGLMASDLGGLATLIAATEAPAVAVAMLLAAFGLTFGSLAMGTGVMLLPKD